MTDSVLINQYCVTSGFVQRMTFFPTSYMPVRFQVYLADTKLWSLRITIIIQNRCARQSPFIEKTCYTQSSARKIVSCHVTKGQELPPTLQSLRCAPCHVRCDKIMRLLRYCASHVLNYSGFFVSRRHVQLQVIRIALLLTN